jgi:HK97 family phage prohead protease
MERKVLITPFKLKSLTKSGQFTGRASVYGNTDSYGDVVMPGAFTQSLKDLGGEIVVLNQHNPSDPIGKAELIDTPTSLNAVGQLVLDLASAKEAYVRLQNGLIDGISIGYEVLKEVYVGNVRQLQEIKLWEISLVTFPANQFARVTDVKGDTESRRLLRTIRTLNEGLPPRLAEHPLDRIVNLVKHAR